MSFLDPSVLGPLFRFNREFYELDDRGHPSGYRNLDQLHAHVNPFMLHRRKADVETELPDRSDRTFSVPMSAEQQASHEAYQAAVANESFRQEIGFLSPQAMQDLDRRQRIILDL